MDKQVVAVLKSLDQKEGVLRELEIKGVKKENIEVVHKYEDNASLYERFFEKGDFVVVVESENEIGHIPVEDEGKLSEHRTPKGHHHQPHHQMRNGM